MLKEVAIELRAKTPKGECLWAHHFDVMSKEDAEAEFVDLWDRIRCRPGEPILESAFRLSRQYGLKIDDAIMRKRSDDYVRFVSLAACLQWMLPCRPILLPIKSVAKLLELDQATVSRYCRWAQEDGLLTKLAEHEMPRGGRRGKAAEYRFSTERLKSA